MKHTGLLENVILECRPEGGGRRGVPLEGRVERGLPLGRLREGSMGEVRSRRERGL